MGVNKTIRDCSQQIRSSSLAGDLSMRLHFGDEINPADYDGQDFYDRIGPARDALIDANIAISRGGESFQLPNHTITLRGTGPYEITDLPAHYSAPTETAASQPSTRTRTPRRTEENKVAILARFPEEKHAAVRVILFDFYADYPDWAADLRSQDVDYLLDHYPIVAEVEKHYLSSQRED